MIKPLLSGGKLWNQVEDEIEIKEWVQNITNLMWDLFSKLHSTMFSDYQSLLMEESGKLLMIGEMMRMELFINFVGRKKVLREK